MRMARNDKAATRPDRDEFVEADVPAAVLCAQCGNADCPGCHQEHTQSGVVSVVPWERLGGRALGRLWATSRAATLNANTFFEALPDGPLLPALRFAVLSELIAASAMGLVLMIPPFLIAPAWVEHILRNDLEGSARFVLAGIPGLAALLVCAHVAHGWALDLGARRSGARGATTRALRFGLYSAGWDLVIGPVGAIVLAIQGGRSAAVSVLGLSIGLPTRSARAFLRGCYGLEGPSARPAMRASYAAAAGATAIGACAVIAVILAVLLRMT
jgi:hypothetical protein